MGTHKSPFFLCFQIFDLTRSQPQPPRPQLAHQRPFIRLANVLDHMHACVASAIPVESPRQEELKMNLQPLGTDPILRLMQPKPSQLPTGAHLLAESTRDNGADGWL